MERFSDFYRARRTDLQVGIDLCGLVDFEHERANILGGEPGRFNGKLVGANRQESNRIHSGVIRQRRCLNGSRLVFRRNFCSQHERATGVGYLAGDRTRDRLSQG